MSSYSCHTDTVFSAYLPPFNSENRAVVFVIYDKLFGLVPYMCCYQRYQHYITLTHILQVQRQRREVTCPGSHSGHVLKPAANTGLLCLQPGLSALTGGT